MTKSPHFSDSTIERRVREADVITRARAARPVQGGEDRLDSVLGGVDRDGYRNMLDIRALNR